MTQTASGTQINTSKSMLPSIQGYKLNFAYEDTQFEQESGDEASLVYTYASTNNSAAVWIALQIAPSVTSEHRWETCLINFPLSRSEEVTVNQLDLRDIQLQSNPPITARYFAFQYKNSNQTQIVLYWYETATFNTNGTAQTKSIMLSVIMYTNSPKTVAQSEAQELPVAEAINNYWQPIKTWTSVALFLSANGLYLSIAFSAILVCSLCFTPST